MVLGHISVWTPLNTFHFSLKSAWKTFRTLLEKIISTYIEHYNARFRLSLSTKAVYLNSKRKARL